MQVRFLVTLQHLTCIVHKHAKFVMEKRRILFFWISYEGIQEFWIEISHLRCILFLFYEFIKLFDGVCVLGIKLKRFGIILYGKLSLSAFGIGLC